MKLVPPDTPDRLQLVAGWLSSKDNYQWLDFGDGRQQVSPEWLKIAMQRRTQVLRLFTSDADETPLGVVALGQLNPAFLTANLWVVLGEKSCAGRGYATRAVSGMLTHAFTDLGMHAVNTWIVEHNPSVRVAEKVGFRPMGRQRQCHYIDGRAYDRLWYDKLAPEHQSSEI